MLQRLRGVQVFALRGQRQVQQRSGEALRVARGRDRSGNADGPLHDLSDFHFIGACVFAGRGASSLRFLLPFFLRAQFFVFSALWRVSMLPCVPYRYLCIHLLPLFRVFRRLSGACDAQAAVVAPCPRPRIGTR